MKCCIEEIGADRILFSIDNPFESFDDACPWFDGLDLDHMTKRKIAKELGSFKDEDA